MGAPSDGPRTPEPLPKVALWLVDGYNALHCSPFRSGGARNDHPDRLPASGETTQAAVPRPFWSKPMRERLVALARCFPDRDAEIWLIFDGPRAPENPERGEQPRLRLHFAPSADDWIVWRVRNAEDPSAIAVVSGDRRLGGRSRHHGAAVVSPRRFLDHCGVKATDPSD